MQILRSEQWRQADFPDSGVNVLTDVGGVYLGFRYLLFEAGRFSMETLLTDAGIYCDPSGPLDCETFYELLNELEGKRRAKRGEEPLAERVKGVFAPMVVEA